MVYDLFKWIVLHMYYLERERILFLGVKFISIEKLKYIKLVSVALSMVLVFSSVYKYNINSSQLKSCN